MAKPANRAKGPPSQPNKATAQSIAGIEPPQYANVPSESVGILEGLGVDLTNPEEVLRFASTIQRSVSSSPYPSPDMLFSYDPYRPGFSDKIIAVVDEQREHRQKLETLQTNGQENRFNRAQLNAFIISIIGIIAAGGCGYLQVDWKIDVAIVIMSIGGPNAATILSRFISPKS